jgi:phage shock protein PspC (stress-responsive transcriptional regulator)
VWLITALIPVGASLIAYVIAWIVLPEEPEMASVPAGQQATNT